MKNLWNKIKSLFKSKASRAAELAEVQRASKKILKTHKNVFKKLAKQEEEEEKALQAWRETDLLSEAWQYKPAKTTKRTKKNVKRRKKQSSRLSKKS